MPAQADEIPQKYRDTVAKGLAYLVKQQHKDGHWEGDDGKHPVAMTGLVGIALLMEADSPTQTLRPFPEFGKLTYLAEVRKAADWLMDQSQAKRDGLIFSEHPSETTRYMEGHGLATIFLAGVCRQETDEARRKKLTEVLGRAVKYIAKAQSSRGGWYHTSKVEGHDFDVVAATALQIQALQAAENAGIAVPHEVVSDAQEYLLTVVGEYESAKPPPHGNRAADTAAALACRHSPSRKGEDKLLEKWRTYCKNAIPVGRDIKLGRDEWLHYYCAQAMFEIPGDAWKNYRSALFDHLQASQNKDGSWPAGDGISVGPVYSAAVWCTVLQLDKASHPSRRPLPTVTVL
jgi:hypothetical protein